MNNYKRLTKKKLRDTDLSIVLDEHNNVIVDRRLFERFIEQHNRLAELEDKIERGTLIALPCKDLGAFPCKMGETVWLIYKRYWNVADKNGFWVLRESKVSPHNKKRFSDDFGKFVFLTYAEAENKLKELQNG